MVRLKSRTVSTTTEFDEDLNSQTKKCKTISTTYRTKTYKTLTKIVTSEYTISIEKIKHVKNRIKLNTKRTLSTKPNPKKKTIEVVKSQKKTNRTESMAKRTKKYHQSCCQAC